jgi:hypothetical protein
VGVGEMLHRCFKHTPILKVSLTCQAGASSNKERVASCWLHTRQAAVLANAPACRKLLLKLW